MIGLIVSGLSSGKNSLTIIGEGKCHTEKEHTELNVDVPQ